MMGFQPIYVPGCLGIIRSNLSSMKYGSTHTKRTRDISDFGALEFRLNSGTPKTSIAVERVER